MQAMTALEHPIFSLGLKSIRVLSGRSWVEIPFKSTSILKQKNLSLVWVSYIYPHLLYVIRKSTYVCNEIQVILQQKIIITLCFIFQSSNDYTRYINTNKK